MSDSKDDGSQSGWAPALMSCPHAQQHVKVLKDPIPDMESNQCSQCNNHTENWLCLHCQQLFCGRFASGHMLQHHQATGHAIAAGLGDLSFWCYSCDSYLNHLSIPNVYVAYARLHVAKFGELPPQQPTHVSSNTSKSRDVDGDEKKMSASTTSCSTSTSSTSSTSTPFIPIEGLTSEQLNSPLVDKILGVIYGNALGDAYGLSTEFLDRDDVKEAYGDAFPPFPGFKLNHHNARWDRGDWTDDTDQMILIMEALVETKGVTRVSDGTVPPVACLFAKKLRQWIRNGFPELGDMGGMGLGMTVGAVCSQPNFVTNPREAATEMWNRSGKKLAANGAVMRTSILGCLQHTDFASVAYNTELFASTTHVDPRCIASCVAVTSAIAMILNGAPYSSDADIARIMERVTEITLPYVKDTPHKDEFLRYLNTTNLSALQLDASESIGYTLKCMGAGLYGLRSHDGFKATMGRLVREAGDADTNGAVCGALLGAKLGYRGLPHDWIAHLPNKAWLDRKIIPFLQLVGAIEK